jgi:CheY-like chemotaxis protein
VRGDERGEAPFCLRELPLAACAIAAARLVPGDGDVDEALEEVFLGRIGRPPSVLERLVRFEVKPAAHLLEPATQFLLHGRECYPRGAVATILLAGVELFFRGKLEAAMPGHHFVTADSADLPDLVIADIARIDPDEVADAFPDTPILGYTNHTDTSGLRRAHEAGFDQVVAKSVLAERAPQLVEDLIP